MELMPLKNPVLLFIWIISAWHKRHRSWKLMTHAHGQCAYLAVSCREARSLTLVLFQITYGDHIYL